MEEKVLLSSIEKLLKALDEHDIIYCHWKSNEHLGEALDGDTDLDILFDPAQRTELELVFDECGLKRFRATPLMQYNAIEDFIGLDQEAAKIWHVHTHYRMTLGENHLKGYTITPWGPILLKDRIQGEADVWTSDPSDEFVLLLCRIALKLRWRDLRRNLGKDDQTEIAWLRERIRAESVGSSADKMVGEKSRKIIQQLYESNLKRKSQFLGLQKALRKELKSFTAYSRFGSWFIRTRREIFWLYGGVKRRLGWSNYSANRRVSPSGGLVVAILGCDGAGKSTTLSYIKKEFNKKLDVVSIYFGSGDGSSSLLRKPMKLVAQKVGGKGVGHAVEKEYEEKKKVSLKSRLYSVAKVLWAVTLAKEKKTKQRQMVKARNNGLLVLTDRYPQSNMPGASDGPLLSRYQNGKGILKRISDWEQRIYESFSVNAPDLTIKLMVPTDVAIARKPEMTVEEIDNKKGIVMGMNISEHTAVIDTSRPFEITRGEVMKEIWDLI
jgi:thymidylate kinase